MISVRILCVTSLIVVIGALIRSANSQDCGTVKYTSELIHGGTYAKRGQWPWLCAMHSVESDEFFCGATLITKKHVLTAAHCFWSKGSYSAARGITNSYVVVGKHDLRYFESASQKRSLSSVTIHPDWNAFTEDFDADIAVAEMEYPVFFTNAVQPICLPNYNSVLIHPLGTVVGWGRSENSGPNKYEHESIPKQIDVKAVTNEECFLHYVEFAKISSHRTYCAGWPGMNIGPCHGDSGGGFYYKVGKTWFIQGIVSSTIIDNGRCDVSKYSVYTNVLKLVDWVKDSLREKVSETLNDIILNCQFIRNFEGLYGCETENVVITNPNVRIANILGLHADGTSNLEVEYVWIKNSQLTHLPRFDAKVFFPNVRKYLITGSKLKNVKRDDFAGFPKMETLMLDDNDLEMLPEDVLYDLPALVDFYVEKNKLRELPTYLLNHAPLFQRFRASNNTIETIEADFFKNNQALKILTLDNNKISKIKVDLRPYKNLKKIDLLNNTCINDNYNDWRKKNSVEGIQTTIFANCR